MRADSMCASSATHAKASALLSTSVMVAHDEEYEGWVIGVKAETVQHASAFTVFALDSENMLPCKGDENDYVAKMKAAEQALEAKERQKPSFELSGKLAKETNKVRGVALLFNEPPDARKPDIRWRLYVFKGGEVLNGNADTPSGNFDGGDSKIMEIQQAGDDDDSSTLYLMKQRMTQALRHLKESTDQHSTGLLQYRTVSVTYMFSVDGDNDGDLGLPGRVFRQKSHTSFKMDLNQRYRKQEGKSYSANEQYWSLADAVVFDALSCPLNMPNYMAQMAIAMDKLTTLEDFVRQIIKY
ncbi:hypothetical protein Cni_G07586 [Canna indica]|uniref:Uncharacterized protein n=1 Tax=Canna indica TaxID=4628 RepID=A0AAQ3Q7P2_9LILI|nr:hypothetical protein Cni_G07586 [Canna indica]